MQGLATDWALCHFFSPFPGRSKIAPKHRDCSGREDPPPWKSLGKDQSGRMETRWDVEDPAVVPGLKHPWVLGTPAPLQHVFLWHWRSMAHPQEVLVEQEQKNRRLQALMPKPSSISSSSRACQGQRVNLSVVPRRPHRCDQNSG